MVMVVTPVATAEVMTASVPPGLPAQLKREAPGACTGNITDTVAASGGDGAQGGTGGEDSDRDAGGGGGGGYYGGGGASSAGGGGGSSYPTATGLDTSGTPSVTITYAVPSPVVTAGATASFTEGGSPVAVDAALTVTDPSGTIDSATVTIASGFLAGDTLNFVNIADITGSYVSSTGVLTLTGADSVGDYQTALESVTYWFTSNADPTGGGTDTSRTIDWSFTDSNDLGSNTATSTVDVADGLCAPGSYNSTNGSAPCTVAPQGYYVGTTGAESATPCSAGTFSTATGATSSATCTPADPGYYVASAGSSSETRIVAGSYSTGGAVTCSPAGPGYYVASAGSSSENACLAGSYSTGGAITCSPADPGYYVASAGSSSENACLAGSYSTGGAITCTPAGPGYYVASAGSSSENACLAGSYSTGGAITCTPAGPGYYVAIGGQFLETRAWPAPTAPAAL